MNEDKGREEQYYAHKKVSITDFAKDEHNRIHDRSINSNESVVMLGINANKSSAIANAGACIGIITFLSQAESTKEMREILVYSASLFFTGFYMTVLSSGITYISQYCYAYSASLVELTVEYPFSKNLQGYTTYRNFGITAHFIAVVLIIISYLFLLCGGFDVYDGLLLYVKYQQAL